MTRKNPEILEYIYYIVCELRKPQNLIPMKFVITITALMVFSLAGFSQENDIDKAKETIGDFKEVDASISELFDIAYGYAVLPAIGKGGIGIGGAGGKGTVFKQGEPVADVRMIQVTLGFQFGGQQFKVEIY